jgi:integrase
MAALDKTNRRKLQVQRKPHFATIAPGLALGYRRNEGAGAWVTREAIGNGRSRFHKFATADDLEIADGGAIMNYAQALVHANRMKRSDKSGKQLVTVEQAIDAYEADLKARGQSKRSRYNATVVRHHLKDTPVYKKSVALLEKNELTNVRNDMAASGLKNATVDRVGKCLKAALNLAANNDHRIANAKTWSDGWAMLPNTSDPRNIILGEPPHFAVVVAIVQAAYQADHKLGVYFDTLAETGTRESQMLRIRVSNLQDDRTNPRLMMPNSFKGKNRKPGHKPVPISARLAAILRQAAAGRSLNEAILSKIDHPELRFREIAKLVGGVDPEATPYSFRHTSIVRMLVKNIPIRIVASLHDTSVAMIEKHYSAYITDVSDAMTRATLPDFGIQRVD